MRLSQQIVRRIVGALCALLLLVPGLLGQDSFKFQVEIHGHDLEEESHFEVDCRYFEGFLEEFQARQEGCKEGQGSTGD